MPGLALGLPIAGVGGAPAFDVRRPDQSNYFKGSFTGYLSPFGAIGQGWTRGAQYEDWLYAKSAQFPGASRIDWRTLATGPDNAQILGYLQAAKWQYDTSGAPPVPLTPRKISDITSLTETFDWNWAGSSKFTLLKEYYLRSSAANDDKVVEIGHWLHSYPAALAYRAGGTLVGNFSDALGTWTVYTQPVTFSAGHDGAYVTLYPQSGTDVLSGTIDDLAVIQWLIAHGIGNSDLYFAGCAIGVEPNLYGGSGSFFLNRWDAQIS